MERSGTTNAQCVSPTLNPSSGLDLEMSSLAPARKWGTTTLRVVFLPPPSYKACAYQYQRALRLGAHAVATTCSLPAQATPSTKKSARRPSPSHGEGARAPCRGRKGLLLLIFLGMLLEAIRASLMVIEAGDCALEKLIASFLLSCILLSCEAPAAPHTRDHTKAQSYPL